jgi:hypothetical protein
MSRETGAWSVSGTRRLPVDFSKLLGEMRPRRGGINGGLRPTTGTSSPRPTHGNHGLSPASRRKVAERTMELTRLDNLSKLLKSLGGR